MINIGDIVTTVEKKEYLYTIEVLEINSDGKKARCLWSDGDGCGYRDYELSDLRPLSVKELANDIYKYYSIEEPKHPFYSKEYLSWLTAEYQHFENVREEIEKECDREGMDIADLPSSELWEYDRAGEKAGWFATIKELLEKEIAQVSEVILPETAKENLVTILNHLIENLGYDVCKDGFAFSEDHELFSLAGGEESSFEEGLEFLMSELEN